MHLKEKSTNLAAKLLEKLIKSKYRLIGAVRDYSGTHHHNQQQDDFILPPPSPQVPRFLISNYSGNINIRTPSTTTIISFSKGVVKMKTVNREVGKPSSSGVHSGGAADEYVVSLNPSVNM